MSEAPPATTPAAARSRGRGARIVGIFLLLGGLAMLGTAAYVLRPWDRSPVRVEVVVRDATTGGRAELATWAILDADSLAAPRTGTESGVESFGLHARLPPGRYVIDLFPTSHAPARTPSFRVWPARPKTIEVEVVRGSALAGRVVAKATKAPVMGAWVFFARSPEEAAARLAEMRRADTRFGAQVEWFPSLAVTDVDGGFRFAHVSAGAIVVAAHRPGVDATREIAVPADPGTGPQPEIRLDDLVLDVDE